MKEAERSMESTTERFEDAAADPGAEARARAEGAKEKIAAGLDRAADRLRQNVETMEPGRRGRGALDRVASGVQSTAEHVRGFDVRAMSEDARAYVRENPTSALLIAASTGLLLGILLARR